MMKKILAAVLSGVLVLGLVIGGITWRNQNGSKGPVDVYSVAELSTTYWGDDNESYGMVTTDRIQNIYLSDTQTVKEVMVEEGQEVKKGDVLMTYDTTLSEVEVLRKDLSIQQMQLDLQKAKSDLSKISTYRPGVPVSDKNQIDTDSVKLGAVAPLSRTLTIGMRPNVLTAVLTGGIIEPSAEESSTEEPTTEEPTSEPETSSDEETTTEEEPTQEPETSESDSTETEAPTETDPAETDPSETETSADETEDPADPEDPEKTYPELIGGRGTEKVPYIFNWNGQWTFDQDLLAYLSQGRKDAFVILKLNAEEADENNTDENTTEAGEDAQTPDSSTDTGSWWKIEIHRDNMNEYTFEMIQMCVDGNVVDIVPVENPDDPVEPDPIEPVEPDDDYDPYIPDYPNDSGVIYTAAEIAEMMSEARDKVRDLELDIRIAKVEQEKMEKELNNGAVYAEFDGIVKSVRDEEEAKVDSKSLIDVSGGGGYYVSGTIGELDLDSVSVGTPVNVMSWDTYMSYVGEIQSISDYPVNDSYYSGAGNSNVSYYRFTVFIDESAELKDMEYVSLTYSSDNGSGGSHFYLQSSMIRTENGKSYVYVANEENKLERRDIRTGKSLWGSYTEIVSGISQEDMVAFPYGKAVKEGAEAVPATLDSLYSYY